MHRMGGVGGSVAVFLKNYFNFPTISCNVLTFKISNSFAIRTSEKCVCNPFRIRAYKKGGGGGRFVH
jgi:hypothetical protein